MDVLNSVKTSLSSFLDLLYPPHCINCHVSLTASKDLLCPECFSRLSLITPPFCKKCSRPVSDLNEEALCGSCINEKHNFDRLISAGIYDGVLKECIHTFKFGKKEMMGQWFAKLIKSHLDLCSIDVQGVGLIVDVPMHAIDRKERGFNQSQVLSRFLSKEISVPHEKGVLGRKPKRESQSSLNRNNRLKNIKNAFYVNKDRSEVAGKRIILIDDIYTTGATSDECARILKKAGALEVVVIVIARGIML